MLEVPIVYPWTRELELVLYGKLYITRIRASYTWQYVKRNILPRFYGKCHACEDSGAQAVFSLPRKKRPGIEASAGYVSLFLRRRAAAGVSACAWVVCLRTHMRVVKMAAIARTVRTENALALQRSSFRENPTYFLTSVRRWVCELVFDAIYDWRSEFSHNRQTDKHDNYSNPRCACAQRVTDKHDNYSKTVNSVTLAAHARRGLITQLPYPRCACAPRGIL